MIKMDKIKTIEKIQIPNRYCALYKLKTLRFDNCIECRKYLKHFNNCINLMKEKTKYKLPYYIKNNPDLFGYVFDISTLQWFYWKL